MTKIHDSSRIQNSKTAIQSSLYYRSNTALWVCLCLLAHGLGVIYWTRASAWRGTNTPGWCHHLISQNNLSLQHWPSRYMAKSLDYDLHINAFYEVKHCDTLGHYTKYDIHPSNSLEDIKQIHWTTKYRSLTYIYFMRSILVSHWSIITSMTFLHQIVFKILSKPTRLQNIGHWPISTLKGQSLCQKCPRGRAVSAPDFGSRGRRFESRWRQDFSPNLNGASLHRAFHVHPSIVSKWLKYCWRDLKPSLIQSLCHTDPLYQVWHSSIK